MNPARRRTLALLASGLVAPSLHAANAGEPLTLAVNAEYGMLGSEAAQSIEKGVTIAIAEINARGGVLGGRKLQVIRRDDRGVPARAVDNMRELAADPSVVAVFCGRFSPVAFELIPVAGELALPLLDPWAAADGIANNGQKPNFVFRLSLTDTWAIETMLAHARRRGYKSLTALAPNNGWGRSSMAAVDRYIKANPGIRIETSWHNWGDTDFSNTLIAARRIKSDALLLIINEAEGKHLLQQMDNLPANERLPMIAHWGITAGDFNRTTNGLASSLDLVTIQTFVFPPTPNARQQRLIDLARRLLDEDIRKLPGLVGFAHAYDLTHLLAMAIDKAGSGDRRAIRNALERLGPYAGLVRDYQRPFHPDDHEALSRQQAFIARYERDGTLQRVAER